MHSLYQLMIINGFGHKNIRAEHATTLAFTRDKDITLRGDCFVAGDCQWEVTEEFLKQLQISKKVTLTIECSGQTDTIIGKGHPDLTLSDKDIVIRKSDWVDARTLMINADKAANDLNRELVAFLKQGAPVTITITA